MRTTNRIFIAAVLAAGLSCATLATAATPADRCQGGKTDAAGKFAACLSKAKRNFAITGDIARRDSAITKCELKEGLAFNKQELIAGPGVCPTESDSVTVKDFVDAYVSLVAEYLDGGTLPADLAACYDDLAACEAQPDAHGLLETGQKVCYNAGGDVIGCSGTGQDGELQEGTPNSYVDNGDGTITDNGTGLMWEKLADDGTIHDKDTVYTFDDSFTKIDTLNLASFAGHADWRLPNIHELDSIVDFGNAGPTTNQVFHKPSCLPGCTVTSCSCTRSANYWSSTAYETDPTCSWKVGFDVGDRVAALKTSTYGVRAVRAGF